jgi:molecular chaperone GrpE
MVDQENPPVENETDVADEAEVTSETLTSETLQEADPQAEVQILKDQLLRTMAELENYRKRAEREREEMAKFAITNFARDLLSVSDNLRRALESVPTDHKNPEDLLKTLLEGVEITEKELLTVFKKQGMEKIEPLGQAFDHHLHQAMFEVEDKDKPAGTIVHVLQPGYSLNGRLLRPAMVGVAK